MSIDTVLRSAIPDAGPPQWPGARWVGLVELPLPPDISTLTLAACNGYTWARLLVREPGVVRGFAEVPIRKGAIDVGELMVAVESLPYGSSVAPAHDTLPISVVLCTRDRPVQLAQALAALVAVPHPEVEIIVVDNASSTDASADVVTALGDPRVRLVREPRPGLARARNRGVLAARHDIVAFTDDDVIVDAAWLDGLTGGFSRSPQVACVCGMVPAGELRTPTQAAFERRVGWSAALRDRVYRLAEPPADVPLFPFQVGCYGTGANFAVHRETLLELGGFDEALGAGSPTRGGEDIDLFVRVVLAGYGLAVEPAAIAWHCHRADPPALIEQAEGYGVGLGAWLAKLLRDPRTRTRAGRRAIGGLRQLRHLGEVDTGPVRPLEPELRAVLGRAARAERLAVVRGALRYRSAHRAARRDALLGGGTT